MRVSVMELGRFTLKGGSGGQPATNLIILHVGGERNAGIVDQIDWHRARTALTTEATERHRGNPREPL